MTRTPTPMILLFSACAFIGLLEGSILAHPPTHTAILPPWVKPTAIPQEDSRTSEDATAHLSELFDFVTIIVNNQNMTIPIAPPLPMSEVILFILEEMEETFQLVTEATVVPRSSTEFKITVTGYYNSEDRAGGEVLGNTRGIVIFCYKCKVH